MASPVTNKRRGAQWELDLLKGLREEGFKVERLRLAGTLDEGDLVIQHGVDDIDIVEAKTGAFVPGMWDEAVREAKQYAKARGLSPETINPVVIKKNPGKSWRQAFVIVSLADYYGLDS